MYRDTTLRYIVKAEDIQGAIDSAGGYEVSSAHECHEKGLEGCFEICVELDADDLKKLLGDPGKGISFKEAERRAKIVEAEREKRYGSVEATGY